MNEAEVRDVQAARDGDRTAFGRLVERHRGRVFALALAIAGDRGEAQELTQETFVRALSSLPRLQEAERFGPWLRGITLTVGNDVRRKAARDRRHQAQAARERAARDPGVEASPAVELARRDDDARALELLRALMPALPDTCRVALELRFGEGLSYAEIGEVLGVPASTVRGLLYRGTRALRQKMSPMLARAQERQP